MVDALVEIQDMAFVPSTVTIHAGQAAGWVNLDLVAHSVVDDADPNIESGDLLPAASCNRTFPVSGTYPYHCGHHPEMTGVVVVEP
jgi:plastocyanin